MSTEDIGTLRGKAESWDDFVNALRRQVEADLPVRDLGRHLHDGASTRFPGRRKSTTR